MHTKTIEYYLGILLMLSSPIQYDVMIILPLKQDARKFNFTVSRSYSDYCEKIYWIIGF